MKGTRAKAVWSGVWLSEHYNNDVLAAWETEQETEDKAA